MLEYSKRRTLESAKKTDTSNLHIITTNMSVKKFAQKSKKKIIFIFLIHINNQLIPQINVLNEINIKMLLYTHNVFTKYKQKLFFIFLLQYNQ